MTGRAEARTESAQAAVTRRYDRTAPAYDLFERPMDLMVRRLRRLLLAKASGATLAVVVGTGRNLTDYPPGAEPTGIDIPAKMPEYAEAHARRHHVDLRVADAQHLPFEDDSFDTVTAACVCCSVADRLSPLVRRMFGPEINRQIEDNIVQAGLESVEVQARGVWRDRCPPAPLIVTVLSARGQGLARVPSCWGG